MIAVVHLHRVGQAVTGGAEAEVVEELDSCVRGGRFAGKPIRHAREGVRAGQDVVVAGARVGQLADVVEDDAAPGTRG